MFNDLESTYYKALILNYIDRLFWMDVIKPLYEIYFWLYVYLFYPGFKNWYLSGVESITSTLAFYKYCYVWNAVR